MRVDKDQDAERVLDLLAQAMGELELGGSDTDRVGVCALLREALDLLRSSSDIPDALRARLKDALVRCASPAPLETWSRQALDDLRATHEALVAAARARDAVKSEDDPFRDYAQGGGFDPDAIQRADEYLLPGSDSGAPDNSADSMAAFERDEGGVSPGRDGYTRAKPPAPEVPRMDEAHAAQPVQLGTSAPAACRPGDEFTARFIAYPPGDEAEVDALLKKLSPRSESLLGLQHCMWKPGTTVRVGLSGKGLVMDPPVQDFIWQGERHLLNFDVTVPGTCAEGVVVLKFDVSIDDITVARLRQDLEIRAGADKASVRSTDAQAATTAFASYSSVDRQRVLDRVAALRISAGMDIFLDCLSLHPGEHWEPRLEDEIRRRDLFLLFWSRPASESKWVEWEWRKALADGKKDDMEIHPLDNGIMPPPELSDLHFADPAMAVRAASGPSP
jgi:hypothetical protein